MVLALVLVVGRECCARSECLQAALHVRGRRSTFGGLNSTWIYNSLCQDVSYIQLFRPHFILLRLAFLKMVMNWEPKIICVKFLLECPFAKRPNAISATSVCYCSASANPWATYLFYQIHITHIGFYQLRQFFLQSLWYIFNTGLIFVTTVQKSFLVM